MKLYVLELRVNKSWIPFTFFISKEAAESSVEIVPNGDGRITIYSPVTHNGD